MIIVGAGGHAREILAQCRQDDLPSLYFFDNHNPAVPTVIHGLKVLTTETEARESLQQDPRFILGTGKPSLRAQLCSLFEGWGGEPFTFTAATAFISTTGTTIGAGGNFMHNAFVSNDVTTGRGCLVNAGAHLHHDVSTGDFCEIGPAALLLGGVRIGNGVLIGAGAIILPGLSVGDGARVGAGAVVTNPVAAGLTVKGNPAV